KYKARVVIYKSGKNFSDWRNKALKEAIGNWILYLDADERITPLLKQEIIRTISSETKKEIDNEQVNAYALARRNFIFNKEFKHSGQYPDYQKRLFRKSALRQWSGDVHEE